MKLREEWDKIQKTDDNMLETVHYAWRNVPKLLKFVEAVEKANSNRKGLFLEIISALEDLEKE